MIRIKAVPLATPQVTYRIPSMTQADALWIFAYGSLLWDAGFDVIDQQRTTLAGYERSFCMRSIHHRGTVSRPGLVLALAEKPGHHCTGMVLRCDDARRAAVLTYLRGRELVSSAYIETRVALSLADGRSITATTFIVDPNHEQYCPDLTLDEQAAIIASATGGRGRNRDYLDATIARLDTLGIPDAQLTDLARRVMDRVVQSTPTDRGEGGCARQPD